MDFMSKEQRTPKLRQGKVNAEGAGAGAGPFNVSNCDPGTQEGLKNSMLLRVVRKWRAYRRPACSFAKCITTKREGEEEDQSSSSPSKKRPTTPRGYLALYVGAERSRFLVKTDILNHPLFGLLLDKAKEEFGFQQKGPLNIPCDTALFKHIVCLAESNNPSFRNADAAHHLLLRGLSLDSLTVSREMRCADEPRVQLSLSPRTLKALAATDAVTRASAH